ncbi:MAG: leucine-rich repeat domain-containing protein [Actinomycetes bacterium]
MSVFSKSLSNNKLRFRTISVLAIAAVSLSMGMPAAIAGNGGGQFVYRVLGDGNIRITGCVQTCDTNMWIPVAYYDGYQSRTVEEVTRINSDTGQGIDFSNVSYLYFEDSADVPSQVKVFGNLGLGGNLQDISLPSSLTTIADGTFSGTNITHISIPPLVTSIGVGALQSPNLEVIDVDPANTAFTSENGVLFNFAKTVLLQYPQRHGDNFYLIPSSVTEIAPFAMASNPNLMGVIAGPNMTKVGDGAFANDDNNLQSLVFQSTTAMELGNSIFMNDSRIDSIYFQCDAPSITNNPLGGGPTINNIYYDVQKSGWSSPWNTFTTIPSLQWRTDDSVDPNVQYITAFVVPDISGNFESGNNLISLNIPSVIDGKDVVGLDDSALNNNGMISELTIPNSVVNIRSWALTNMWGLKTLDLGNGVANLGYGAISSDPLLTSLDIPNSVVNIEGNAITDLQALSHLTLGTGLTEIQEGAISMLPVLTTVEIPANVNFIGDQAMDQLPSMGAFTVNSANTSYIADGGVLFTHNKSRLLAYPAAKAYVSAYAIPSTVIAIGSLALAGTQIGTVSIPAGVSDIGYRAFGSSDSDSAGFTAITVDGANDTYASIDGVLYDKEAHYLIQFPNQKSGAFVVPSSVTEIDHWAYQGNEKLVSLVLPDGIRRVRSGAFSNMSALKTIVIPAHITSVEGYAFNADSSLTNVVFLGNVPTVGTRAFQGLRRSATIWHTSGAQGWDNANNPDFIRFNKALTATISYHPGTKAATKATLAGIGKVGKVITVKTGTWISPLLPAAFSYQWYRCSALGAAGNVSNACVLISTSSKYKLTSVDRSYYIQVRITGIGVGQATAVTASTKKVA